MTIKEYNEKFYPQCNKAFSFVNCLDHALQKSDDNARMQMKVIGWDDETKDFLLDALFKVKESTMKSLKGSEADTLEVVRCKDCKHATFYSCKNDACYRGIICEYKIGIGDENFFCACGERR